MAVKFFDAAAVMAELKTMVGGFPAGRDGS